ncbi:MAG: pitrilysin family protein [Candidatus Komeilibacteria bacterium]|nr:pitrilysin family protein [Candidatus Komeilibacteria bacterium]
MSQHSFIRLNNNVPVIIAPQSETKAATALILVKVGSRYEPAKINGVSHFIEHLLFKGTKKWPRPELLVKMLDGLGADYNAFTSKDYTGYYIKAASEHLPLVLEILSDMLFAPLFDKKEMQRERGVIIEEINMYEDNPLMQADARLEEAMYPNHPLGRLISGPAEIIGALPQAELVNYYRKHYHLGNIVIGLAGDVGILESVELLNKYFGKAKATKKSASFPSWSKVGAKKAWKVWDKPTEQVQLALGWPAFHNLDKRIPAAQVLATLLGGNMSSRLFMEIREKKGLAYFVKAQLNTFEDTGNLAVQAGLKKEQVEQAITAIIEEINSIKKGRVTKEEVERAKEFLKGKMVLRIEDSSTYIHWLTDQYLLEKGRVKTIEEQLTDWDRVSLAEVVKVANEIFRHRLLSGVAIGPQNQLQKLSLKSYA